MNAKKDSGCHAFCFIFYRKIEELQADLSTSTQKWHNLNNQHEQVKREKEREIETLIAKNHDNISNVNSKLDDLVSTLHSFKYRSR